MNANPGNGKEEMLLLFELLELLQAKGLLEWSDEDEPGSFHTAIRFTTYKKGKLEIWLAGHDDRYKISVRSGRLH